MLIKRHNKPELKLGKEERNAVYREAKSLWHDEYR